MRVCLMITTILLLTGCQILRPSVEKLEETKTTIEYRDTTVYLPGEVVRESLDLKKLEQIVAGMKPGSSEKIIYTSAGGSAELSFYKDALGRVMASCESKDKQIDLLLQDRNTTTKKSVVETKIKKETPKGVWGLIGALLAVILLLLVTKR